MSLKNRGFLWYELKEKVGERKSDPMDDDGGKNPNSVFSTFMSQFVENIETSLNIDELDSIKTSSAHDEEKLKELLDGVSLVADEGIEEDLKNPLKEDESEESAEDSSSTESVGSGSGSTSTDSDERRFRETVGNPQDVIAFGFLFETLFFPLRLLRSIGVEKFHRRQEVLRAYAAGEEGKLRTRELRHYHAELLKIAGEFGGDSQASSAIRTYISTEFAEAVKNLKVTDGILRKKLLDQFKTSIEENVKDSALAGKVVERVERYFVGVDKEFEEISSKIDKQIDTLIEIFKIPSDLKRSLIKKYSPSSDPLYIKKVLQQRKKLTSATRSKRNSVSFSNPSSFPNVKAYKSWKKREREDIEALIKDVDSYITYKKQQEDLDSKFEMDLTGGKSSKKGGTGGVSAIEPLGKLKVSVLEARNLYPKTGIDTTSPYVRLILGDSMAKTSIFKNSTNPKWEGEDFIFPVYSVDDVLNIDLWCPALK